MAEAFSSSDSQFDGVFYSAVRTTGIFCRPSCTARKPKLENVEYYPTAKEALFAGYRPCKRCRPMEPAGSPPPWLDPLLQAIEEDPLRRWTDEDLRRMNLDPLRVRRWFQATHSMTFHAYQRARRLAMALGRIRLGEDVTDTAYEHGFESLSGFREAFEKMFGATPGRSRSTKVLVVNRIVSPLGPMVVGVFDEMLCLLEFSDRRMSEAQVRKLQRRLACAIAPGEHDLMATVELQLKEYFGGARREFNLPLFSPGTPFQERVWEELRLIPYGETITYGQQAARIARPQAVRAVARANGDYRIGIIIPCHRVVGSDGELTGYGGGLWRKRYLLDLERGNRMKQGDGSHHHRPARSG
jgi:AraC family transcriptional regulator of adaptative response/methylated-DNA-[protein]-cysteine methyltransferase